MPRLAHTPIFVIFALYQLFIYVQGDTYPVAPECAQPYLQDAYEASSCNSYQGTNARAECYCQDTGYLTNSALGIGANCGCPVLSTSAQAIVDSCNDVGGPCIWTESEIIAAGNNGDPSCFTTATSPSSPSTTVGPSSPTTPSAADSNPDGVTNLKSSGGLDADGKASLALGIPAAIVAIIQLVGWIRYKSWRWMFDSSSRGQPQIKTLYHPVANARALY